ncbi:hypothetical protein KAFR_0A02290 [Kazachstania africana CBS 2517]|uniref:SH3 domain-containing protein n=1 Tax=Kazachstania africana (strain ATCC 22294 / BCRC 22015 / CBS 2517 / CECT 1963 / NBRC 1671 / NRRL Y-8276) TaxID=1071382 RepID=H2AMR7_KAZAF|nr:hypothetical protein KAFR_0A02290 [Kazachstania africana CBS 2517]CCF55667.1 hypothetical protein KAFR_0A02290 [Kazachstania africana CBS 2517]
MAYDYESCFWDPNDDGVNILLSHIASGIKSCDTVEHFFKQKSELEKDYARRMGAINERLKKDMMNNTEFGQLNAAMDKLLLLEKARAQSYSKQSELIYRKLYSDIKLFIGELNARYTTLSGKVEKLRLDKFNKKKGCEELAKRLDDASIRARDLQLNKNNIIGFKRVEQMTKELAKWENNVHEFSLQLNVLKQEYKASKKYWLHEWGNITQQLQEMEVARIRFVQSKMQQYAEAALETTFLEQSKTDSLINELSIFTPMDDISKFSREYGTGRLKERRSNLPADYKKSSKKRLSVASSIPSTIDHNPDRYYVSSMRDPHIDAVRKLSSQLQQSTLNRSAHSGTFNKQIPNEETEKPLPSIISSTSHEVPTKGIKIAEDITRSLTTDMFSQSAIRVNEPTGTENNISHSKSVGNDFFVHDYRDVPGDSRDNLMEVEDKPTKLSGHPASSSSSSGSSSSNPTDFTSNIPKKQSFESMATSVSSMANTIDDKQRFAKSWNSTNRKRKSMSNISSLTGNSDSNPVERSQGFRGTSTATVINTSVQETRDADTNIQRISYSNTKNDAVSSIRSRRKSMVLENSKHPIEDALYEMEKLQGGISHDTTVGRVKDNGVVVTLPIVSKGGDKVIHYAKALYPLLDNDAPTLAHFDKNDYILITEVINDDWYRGEVYGNDMISPEYRDGLIPYNFIHLLD